MTAVASESGALPISLSEARDWLRLGPSDADAHVAGLIRAATSLCESFTGQMLIEREVTEERSAASGWMRLLRQPVVAIVSVQQLREGEAPIALAAADWTFEFLDGGAGAVRLHDGGKGARLMLRYLAGLAGTANAVPEALRQGLLRLVQHWHFAGTEDQRLPAIVTALWTPWRRVSL